MGGREGGGEGEEGGRRERITWIVDIHTLTMYIHIHHTI